MIVGYQDLSDTDYADPPSDLEGAPPGYDEAAPDSSTRSKTCALGVCCFILIGSLYGYSFASSNLERKVLGGIGIGMTVITGLALIRLCLDLCPKFGVDDTES